MADTKMEMEGIVVKCLKGSKFEVELTDNKHIVTCTVSGRMMKNNIKILLGDKVTVKISEYDLSRGIISWRSR